MFDQFPGEKRITNNGQMTERHNLKLYIEE